MTARVGRTTWAGLLIAASAAAAVADAAERAQFTLRVEAEREGRRFGVGAGDRLRSGDRLQLFVDADRDVYVHVLQFFARGAPVVHFPVEESGFLPSGVTLRVPQQGYWLQLDEATGEEHVYVVVSTRPLGEVDAVVAAAVERVRTSAGPPPPSPRAWEDDGPVATAPETPGASAPRSESVAASPSGPAAARERPAESAVAPPAEPAPPQGFGLLNRGLVRVAGPEGAVVELDEAGLAIHRFWFFHDPG
jgi:hypothetical protein